MPTQPPTPDETYADSVLIEIVPIDEMARLAPIPDRVVWVEAHSFSAPAGWMEESALASLGDAEVTDAFYLDHTRRVTEWGASGAAETLIITLAESLFVEAAVLTAGHFARRLAARLRHEDSGLMPEEDAIAWAKLRVAIKYDLRTEDLSVTRVSQREAETAVELADVRGVRFRLTLRGAGAGVVMAECTREFPE